MADIFSLERDHVAGYKQPGSPANYALAVTQLQSDGTETGVLPAGTNRSGTATTTSALLAAANANRRSLKIQNVGANNIGVNEFGAVAAIGSPGTNTVPPLGTMKVETNRAVNVIAATSDTNFTATEI